MYICNCLGFEFAFPDAIYLTKTRTRLDLVEPSLSIWSGPRFGIFQCSFTCRQEPQCVSLLFNKTTKLCKLFNVIYDGDESGNVENYYIISGKSKRFGKLILIKLWHEILFKMLIQICYFLFLSRSSYKIAHP